MDSTFRRHNRFTNGGGVLTSSNPIAGTKKSRLTLESSSSASSSASSTLSSNDIKANLGELKSSMSEMKNLNKAATASSSYSLHSSNFSNHHRSSSSFLKPRASVEASPSIIEMNNNNNSSSAITNVDDVFPVDDGPMPIITSPDLEYSDSESAAGLTSPNLVSSCSPLKTAVTALAASTSSSATATSTSSSMSFAAEETAVQASRVVDSGVVAETASGVKHQQRFVAKGERIEAASSKTSVSGSKVSTSSSGYHHLHHHSSSSSSSSRYMSMSTTSILSASQIKQMMNNTVLSMEQLDRSFTELDELDLITPQTNLKNVQNALIKYCGVMSSTVQAMKTTKADDTDSLTSWMSRVNDMMSKAWRVPTFGYEIGNTLCEVMRHNGGLDILMDSCAADEHTALQFNAAKLLQQCLVTENRGYVVERGLDKVVAVARRCSDDFRDVQKARVGMGILEHLFKHSESTCGEVIAMGGLDTVVAECKSSDVETLRHCASALANVAMYGGSENQEVMIQRKIPFWLFPLAFHSDDTIKYYACLAIAVLVANKEIEAAVQKSGALGLIAPFVESHSPAEFAEEISSKRLETSGQSPHWLRRLVPVLASQREEARNLAAFHFSMEAEIKKQCGQLEMFRDIPGGVEALKKVASSPSGLAAKYAAQALRTIGEEVPHKLSRQVPTWSVEDVVEWVRQIGFYGFADAFLDSKVDGDLLLQLTEDMLREDIGMRNGILRRRFMRELTHLKQFTDYSSCDQTDLGGFLQSLGTEFTFYTYAMLNSGIDRHTLMTIQDEALLADCGISNRVHRLKIQRGIKIERGDICPKMEEEKNLDVFISYRRSNGSQLASLLKVHLEIRNYSVFLDVDRLEAGKFDNNLLRSIRSARNFVLVCTPGAMDRCFGDVDQRDWIHKEVACAIDSQCNIIPVLDNFIMPEATQLPDTMRAIISYNGVKWIHDYQEACVDKIDRFMKAVDGLCLSNSSTVCKVMTFQRMASHDNNDEQQLSHQQQT